jgi:two-component system chemotaxis response regulator CheB
MMGLKALVVEDSLVFQKIMGQVLADLDGVDQVQVAATGQQGLDLIRTFKPDVVFLDLHLPDMDGMDLLDEVKRCCLKTKVVVVSGMSEEGADLTVKALSKGAQQFIGKPSSGGFQSSVDALRAELEPVIKTVTLQTRMHTQMKTSQPPRASRPMTTPTGQLPARAPVPVVAPARPTLGFGTAVRPPVEGVWVTAIAVSTGGPEALSRIIPRLPADYPVPVVVVQHMPPLFTDSLAKSLDSKSQVRVVEARAGMTLEAGTVYIAPGGKHLVVRKVDGKAVTSLNEDPPEQSVRPAADVLFRSLARCQSQRAVLAVVLTGMGEDGLAGLRSLKLTNCLCLTQTEESCVVYGMPRAVDKAGLSDGSIPLDSMAEKMVRLVRGSKVGAR